MNAVIRSLIERFYGLPLSGQEVFKNLLHTSVWLFPERLDKIVFRKRLADQMSAESIKNEIAFGLFLEKYFHEHSIF